MGSFGVAEFGYVADSLRGYGIWIQVLESTLPVLSAAATSCEDRAGRRRVYRSTARFLFFCCMNDPHVVLMCVRFHCDHVDILPSRATCEWPHCAILRSRPPPVCGLKKPDCPAISSPRLCANLRQ